MTTLTVYVCACETPQPYTRPSGTVICAHCGMPIVPKLKPEDRP